VRLTPTESDTPPPPQASAPPDPPDVPVTVQGVNMHGEVSTEGSTGGGAEGNGEVAFDPTPADVDSTSGPSDETESPAAAAGRRALRETRRQRRRAMWLCAAVVALCLALTIVVVTLARYRPVGLPSALATTTGTYAVVHAPAPVVDRILASTFPSRGAPAPEGGNP